MVNEEYSLLGPGNKPNSLYEERLMKDDEDVDDLCLKVDDELLLNYDYYSDWDFRIYVTDVYEDNSNQLFEVLNGRGNGIIEDLGKFYNLRDFLNSKNEKMNNIRCNNIKGYKEYISYVFDVDDINLK